MTSKRKFNDEGNASLQLVHIGQIGLIHINATCTVGACMIQNKHFGGIMILLSSLNQPEALADQKSFMRVLTCM